MTGRPRATIGAFVFPALLVIAAAAAAVLAGSPADPGPWVFLLVLDGWVITLSLHEFAHAAVALSGGDSSVRARGYLTLNPLRYTDPVFSLVIPALLLAVGGIPLPGGAVLIETHRLRRRWWSSLVSAAGPLTNLVLGVVLVVVAARLGAGHVDLAAALSFLAELQFLAALLNLLPVPGLDGFGVLAPYLPATWNRAVARIRPWAALALFALLFEAPQIGAILFRPAYAAFEAFGGNRSLAAFGGALFSFWRH